MTSNDEAERNNGKTLNVAFRGHKDGTVEFFSDHIEAMTGYTKEEFNSKRIKWTDIVLDEYQQAIKKAFIDALKTDKTYKREYKIRGKDQRILWVQEWSQIVCNAAGEVDFVLGIIVDVTRQKELEEQRIKCEQKTGKYLVFTLLGQDYGVNILQVREILGLLPITPIPQSPQYIKGVINLRGQLIPVVDLAVRLGLEPTAYTDRTCIIVLESASREQTARVGMIVDSVAHVVYMKGQNIEDLPDDLIWFRKDYVLGIAKQEEGNVILLDVDRELAETSLASLQQMS